MTSADVCYLLDQSLAVLQSFLNSPLNREMGTPGMPHTLAWGRSMDNLAIRCVIGHPLASPQGCGCAGTSTIREGLRPTLHAL